MCDWDGGDCCGPNNNFDLCSECTCVCDWTLVEWSGATWDCCSALHPCELGGGDCDNDGECAGNLVCGSNNCGGIFESTADCCINSTCKELKNR